MAKRRVNDYVVCPYYREETPQVIFCEGVEDDSTIHVAFATPDKRKKHEDQYCKQCWCKCMIAEAHNRKWGYNA